VTPDRNSVRNFIDRCFWRHIYRRAATSLPYLQCDRVLAKPPPPEPPVG
jgi:hypothetical protein